MTPPNDLSVRIAEELNLKLSGILTEETVTKLAISITPHLAPLLEDKAAMDWLEAHPHSVQVGNREPDYCGDWTWCNLLVHNLSSPKEQTLRAAIRAARAGRTG